MADSTKKEKIAAARKKLKQFQKTGKGPKSCDSTASPKAKIQKSDKRDNRNSAENDIELDRTDNSISDYSYSDNTLNSTTEITDLSVGSTNSQSAQGDNHTDIADKKDISDKTQQQTNLNSQLRTRQSPSPYQQDTRFHYNRRQFTSNMTERPTASTESLHQLSRQINGILAESPVGFESVPCQSSVVELEARNRELAALLAQHSQANEQLTQQNEQIRQHALGLQSQLDKERSEATRKITQEIGPLKEQLQVHIQTIGILVAEKTELQSQLSQSQKLSEQRFTEVEDLTGRLKTSRQRVADLERSVSTTNNSSQKLEQTNRDSAKEIDRLKLELYKINKSHEDLKQTSSETVEKLKSKTSECSAIQHTLDELKRKLEMAELYNQQLSNQNEAGQSSLEIVKQLQDERDALATQVQQFTESFQKVSAEREQMTEQYQQYMSQIQNQNSQLTSQISSLTEDQEKLVMHNHELEAAVLELQRRLEEVSNQKPEVDETAHAELMQEIRKLQTEYTDLRDRHEGQIRDNAQLSRYLEDKEVKIMELEGKLEELGEMAGDKAELLENIQSDKTALSRALTQNKDLKTQLAELQNGFVKMSNDNMEMMTQLQTEQHASRDVKAKLAQQEDELKLLKETLSQQEVLLKAAEENSSETNKVKILHEQIQDRLRHYEAQAQLVETLKKELHSSKDMVDALTTQNSELRTMLIRATETRALNPDENVENAQRDDVIGSLQNTIKQLEMERNQLMDSLRSQRDLSDNLGVKISDLEEQKNYHNSSSMNDNDKIPKQEYDKIKYALDMIQDKYNRVMRDKADLSDKADELEHLVLQLQGETDTIGEYISLYHHQRALLQQREIQKNQYIAQLAKDREELQEKLGELQALVMQLMGEKNMLHRYNEEFLRPISPSIHPPVSGASSSRKMNGRMEDWPDYTSSESETESEVETIVGGKDDVQHLQHSPVINSDGDALDNSRMNNNSPTSEQHGKHSNHHHNHHHHQHHQHQEAHHRPTHSKGEPGEEKQTAHKILNLLSEIGQSSLVDNLTFLEKQFHPCKYCKGRLQVL